eukprot:6177773-Pleurochrysis_carterae.AAC.1
MQLKGSSLHMQSAVPCQSRKATQDQQHQIRPQHGTSHKQSSQRQQPQTEEHVQRGRHPQQSQPQVTHAPRRLLQPNLPQPSHQPQPRGFDKSAPACSDDGASSTRTLVVNTDRASEKYYIDAVQAAIAQLGWTEQRGRVRHGGRRGGNGDAGLDDGDGHGGNAGGGGVHGGGGGGGGGGAGGGAGTGAGAGAGAGVGAGAGAGAGSCAANPDARGGARGGCGCCDVIWSDDPVKRPQLLALPPFVITNRLFAMVRMCRKVCLARMLQMSEVLYPSEFTRLAPRTWCVGKGVQFKKELASHRNFCKTNVETARGGFIVKPDDGCQGAGIQIVADHRELAELLQSDEFPPQRAVVQTYLQDPLLIDGFKFDLRLYVIVTCTAPLRAYLSTHGVARFATKRWVRPDATNRGDMLMHLSNSSVNQARSSM